MRFVLVASMVLVMAAAPRDPVADDLDALKAARSEQQAGAFEAHILAAWRAQLTPSVQLLVERAQMSLQRGKPKDGLADFDAALDLQPEAADLWRQRAEARFAGGDDQGAVADLAQALSREPRCFPALVDLSRFAESRDDFKRALAAWEKLLEIDPKAQGADARLQRLQHKVSGQPT